MQSQPATIFEQLEDVSNTLFDILCRYDFVDEGHDYPWPNYVFKGPKFRRAHLDIVDVRDTKKLYMLHLTVFPHTNDGAPIYGFDIIAGAKKVTGAFHDFSPIDPEHPLVSWFANEVKDYSWKKDRNLPDWAKRIFSSSMVAAGNITDPEELQRVLKLATDNLIYYLDNIGSYDNPDFRALQNTYCQNQKENPHTPKVMQSLGFPERVVNDFIQECLFPEL